MFPGYKLSTPHYQTQGHDSVSPGGGRTDHYSGGETEKSQLTTTTTC